MKFIALSAALLASIVPAHAASQGDYVRSMMGKSSAPAVPTGYQVSGKTHYYLENGGRVVQVDCTKANAFQDVKLVAACGRGSSGGGEATGVTSEAPAQ